MNKDEIRALLLRIVNEPGYRDLLIADPVQALAQAGITFAQTDVPVGGVKLPSNEDIEAKLDELTNTVESAKSHITALLYLGG